MIEIFVFGSNLRGIHSAGAALTALQQHGAKYGIGEGRTGNSYALPTMDHSLYPLSLTRIAFYINRFKDYARNNPAETFMVTRIGCGYCGKTNEEIALLFRNSPDNCEFDIKWEPFLELTARFWGTY